MKSVTGKESIVVVVGSEVIENGWGLRGMIIFDLDGTLADCEHRRHFVDPSKRNDCYYHFPATLTQSEGWFYKDIMLMCEPPKAKKFIPDWPAFFEDCDKDEPIKQTLMILSKLIWDYDVQIWSARCESTRKKTLDWFLDNWFIGIFGYQYEQLNDLIKMRPIGNSEPDEVLKERWLNEAIAEGKQIDFVFDDRPKVIRMWRNRGIFVFNCLQHDGEF